MPGWLAAAFQQNRGALLGAKTSTRIGIRKTRQHGTELLGIGLEPRPPVAVEVVDDCARTENFLDASDVLAGHAEHHVNQFRQAKRLRSEERRVGKECRSRWSPY